MKKEIKQTYDVLQKNRKKIKRRSIFFAAFLFCVNAYAWFIYTAQANGTVDADIVKWGVNFYENSVAVDTFEINIDDMYPGMDDITNTVAIQNQSDLAASLTYEIDSFTLLGVPYTIDTINDSNNLISKLENDLPFKIRFVPSKVDLLPNGDYSDFQTIGSWPYESIDEYYKLTNDYTYVPYFNYYDVSHNLLSINSGNFATNVANGLYIESDDADTYWAEKCHEYLSGHDDHCISLSLKITVVQKEE